MDTIIQTATVSKTKLLVATGLMLAAGGLAFIMSPFGRGTSYTNAEGNKCGVNYFSVSASCGTGNYRYAKVTCMDGTNFRVGSASSCKSGNTWASYADKLCRDRCYVPAPPAPTLTCRDSDRGQNFTARGETMILENGATTTIWGEDSCTSSTTLQEYFCGVTTTTPVNARLESVYHVCEGRCNEGRCVTPEVGEVRVNRSAFQPSVFLPSSETLLAGVDLYNLGAESADVRRLAFEFLTASSSLPSIPTDWTVRDVDRGYTSNGTYDSTSRKIVFSSGDLPLRLPGNSMTTLRLYANTTNLISSSTMIFGLRLTDASDLIVRGTESAENLSVFGLPINFWITLGHY